MKAIHAGVFVTATDTEVGKTFFAGFLIRALRRRGINAGYFKPVASGCRLQDGDLIAEDLLFVQRFTGEKMEHDPHCPVRYVKPLAPLAAARLEKRPFDLEKIREAFERLKRRYSFLVVEGIGGAMVPLKENYLVLDLMVAMGLPAVVVCRPGLGTINHTLLTLLALKSRDIPVWGFLTNGCRNEADEAVVTSPDLISRFGRVPYLGHIPEYDAAKEDPDAFIDRQALFLQQFTGNRKDL